MRKKIYNILILPAALAALFWTSSCNGFLNVVPDDGLPSVETAFNLRSSAIRYLSTCYSYMTTEGAPGSDCGMLTGDELWDLYGRIISNTGARVSSTLTNIARGNMSATTVYGDDWASMYEGIRCCDILIDNVYNVPDMDISEQRQWVAEANFLKAYYHFNLVRKWGPVPLIYESLPIDSSIDEVRLHRSNIDSCFNYILRLLDKAEPYLPVVNPSEDEYGRITRAICAAFKARVAVYAASPLFNGNEDEAALVDVDGSTRLFPEKTEAEKQERWEYAVTACQNALQVCQEANIKLYDGSDISFRMSDSLKTSLTLRNAMTLRWNSDLIWGNTQTASGSLSIFHRLCMPILNGYTDMIGGYKFIGVPLKIAEQFYTRHGLPISNDVEWANINPYDLRVGDAQNAYYIRQGYTTVKLNFDREPRFYAYLGFDGGTWLGQLGNYNDLQPEDLHYVQCRMGGAQAKTGKETGPVTGYFPKKMFPYQCTWSSNNVFVGYWFPWPMIRITDLYLLYAEAINEAEGPNGAHSSDLFECIDAIRARAGIPDVKTAWDDYSNAPGYYNTKVGMRDIIHRERLNELAFERVSERNIRIRRHLLCSGRLLHEEIPL